VARVNFDLRDAHVYGGTLLAGYGAYLLHPGAGFLLVGLLLPYFGVRQVRSRGARHE